MADNQSSLFHTNNELSERISELEKQLLQASIDHEEQTLDLNEEIKNSKILLQKEV